MPLAGIHWQTLRKTSPEGKKQYLAHLEEQTRLRKKAEEQPTREQPFPWENEGEQESGFFKLIDWIMGNPKKALLGLGMLALSGYGLFKKRGDIAKLVKENPGTTAGLLGAGGLGLALLKKYNPLAWLKKNKSQALWATALGYSIAARLNDWFPFDKEDDNESGDDAALPASPDEQENAEEENNAIGEQEKVVPVDSAVQDSSAGDAQVGSQENGNEAAQESAENVPVEPVEEPASEDDEQVVYMSPEEQEVEAPADDAGDGHIVIDIHENEEEAQEAPIMVEESSDDEGDDQEYQTAEEPSGNDDQENAAEQSTGWGATVTNALNTGLAWFWGSNTNENDE